jgi:hypothetical protein
MAGARTERVSDVMSGRPTVCGDHQVRSGLGRSGGDGGAGSCRPRWSPVGVRIDSGGASSLYQSSLSAPLSLVMLRERSDFTVPAGTLSTCAISASGSGQGQARASAKSRFVRIYFISNDHVVTRRHTTLLVQAGSQIPATGIFGIWCRPRLCRGPGLGAGPRNSGARLLPCSTVRLKLHFSNTKIEGGPTQQGGQTQHRRGGRIWTLDGNRGVHSSLSCRSAFSVQRV